MQYLMLVEKVNRVHNLLHHGILLSFRVLSIFSLLFEILFQRIFTPFQLKYNKLVTFSICKECMPIEFDNVGSLTDSHNTHLSNRFSFIQAQLKFKSRLSFFHEVIYSKNNSICSSP